MPTLLSASATPLPQNSPTQFKHSPTTQPASQYLLSLIKSTKTFSQLKEIHTQIIKTGHHKESHLLTTLISSSSSFNEPHYAKIIFQQIPNPNVFHWTSIITAFSRNSFPIESLLLFKAMLEFGSNPNNFTFSSILSACASINAIREGEQVHSLLVKYGLHWDIYIETALIILYAKSMRLVDSHQIFEKMPSKNLAAQNSMIYAYTNCGRMEDADALFREVPEKDFVTYTSMIMGYGGCGDIESACILFDEMPERNVGAWNTMILVYSRNGYGNEALSIFSEMLTSGIDANELTLASMLSVCGKYGFSSMGRGLHSYIMKLGMKIDEYLGSGLIDMYAKCGFIEMAEQVFLQMSDKKLASWNAMIFGFGAHGHGEAALAKFSEMEIEGIIPNDLTLLGVLSSCSHSGLVHEGCLNFSTMVQKHKLVPKLEHYSCLVDLLGRAGHLNEALDTIKNMSMEPDVFVWGSLLSACRMHSNVELGEYALERILELDAKHSGGYVLLSNIYSSMGQWDCASQIKVAMREKGVEKSFPGCSWIEVKKVVHRFHASDRSHPQTHEVYEILNFLSRELKNNWSIC